MAYHYDYTHHHHGVDEIKIWKDFKQGSLDAYALLYDSHAQALFDYGIKLSADRELVKDAIHDLFAYLWEHRTNLGNVISVKAYLFKSLKREILRKLKQKGRFFEDNFTPKKYDFYCTPSYETELIATHIQVYHTETLHKALQELSDRQREAIFLRFFNDLSYEEIADTLSISVRATYKLLYRAMHILHKYFFAKESTLLFLIASLISL